jgi:hypothetical protein
MSQGTLRLFFVLINNSKQYKMNDILPFLPSGGAGGKIGASRKSVRDLLNETVGFCPKGKTLNC